MKMALLLQRNKRFGMGRQRCRHVLGRSNFRTEFSNFRTEVCNREDDTATFPTTTPASGTRETLPAAQKTQVDLKALLDG